jgi:predicted DNA-binding antitoxin AbrB/MazE fold protein
MLIMEIEGHYQNGLIIPHDGIPLPDGTEVTITVRPAPQVSGNSMTDDDRNRYLAALARIDAVSNENPGDAFSGADHDRALYGNGL